MTTVRSLVDKTCVIREPVNIYDSRIDAQTKVAAFVEIGGSQIGEHCKIEAFVFIPPGVKIGNWVFVGPHVCFTNDKYPSARSDGAWRASRTVVKDWVSIGANSTILPGITIGHHAMIGAGSVVTKDVPAHSHWIGTTLIETGVKTSG